ncbi:hypothetical protein Pelo_1071 [Pelomyxa schiedti]|nr:hypothetical protein Pelo_1071 [Pelomyxa schiedti]
MAIPGGEALQGAALDDGALCHNLTSCGTTPPCATASSATSSCASGKRRPGHPPRLRHNAEGPGPVASVCQIFFFQCHHVIISVVIEKPSQIKTGGEDTMLFYLYKSRMIMSSCLWEIEQ